MKIIISNKGLTDAFDQINTGIIILENLKLPFEGILFPKTFFERNKVTTKFLFQDLNLSSLGAKLISDDEFQSFRILNAWDLKILNKKLKKLESIDEGYVFDPRGFSDPKIKRSLDFLLKFKYFYKRKKIFCKNLRKVIQNSTLVNSARKYSKDNLFVHYRLGDIAAIPDIFTNEKNSFYFRRLDQNKFNISKIKDKPNGIRHFTKFISPITYERILDSEKINHKQITFCSDGFDYISETATKSQLGIRSKSQFCEYLTEKFLGKIMSKCSEIIIGENEENFEKVVRNCISSNKWISGGSKFPFFIFENASIGRDYKYQIKSSDMMHHKEVISYLN